MKISYNWLQQFLPKTYIDTPENISDLLTDIGLEVEGLEEIESVKGGLKGLVVGHVEDIWQHPNADRLRCTKVNIGTDTPLDIVCGAANVDKGQKVIVATVGAQLTFSDGAEITIKKSKLRGEPSEGMICAEDEIGMGQSHDGIMVLPSDTPVGMPAAEYFDIESDFVFEIGLTPNRADAISHFGVARDIVAAKNVREQLKGSVLFDAKFEYQSAGKSPVSIEIKSPERCNRYAGVVIENLKVEESPSWLKNALLSIGITPKNNLVDLTNYVCHSIGQPLHAFDMAKVTDNKIIVSDGFSSKFTTLDGEERTLHTDDLMICNSIAPMCIAGVFGGLQSGVSDSTTSIFLESAYFNPVSIRKSAKRHALNTDASYRFERGIDPHITVDAILYTLKLLKELCPDAKIYDIVDDNSISETHFDFDFSPFKANELLGLQLSNNDIELCLTSLDIEVDAASDLWKLRVPNYRVDVQRQADVAEEILRLKGFNSVEIPSKLSISIADSPRISKDHMVNAISRALVANGYQEAMNNSLSSEKHEGLFNFNSDKAVKMLNPLSQDLDIMRQNLIGGLIKNVQHNVNRQRKDLKIFEFGRTYFKGETYSEGERLCIVSTGKINGKHWSGTERSVSYFDLKTSVDNLLNMLLPGAVIKCKEGNSPEFGYCITYSCQKKTILTLGAVQEKGLKACDINQEVFAAEFDLINLFDVYKNQKTVINDLPKFPEVRRDLSFLIATDKSYMEVEQIVKSSEKSMLKSIGLFDLYEGKKLPEGKKSYAIYMVFRDENKTLEDAQIDKAMAKIIKNLTNQLDIEIRQ
tara:strand:+ start:202334 stop:204760 length:2427 start_codon:yes stop_codon:yes gene_type:complete